jgi:hypothetical protein
MISKYHVIPVDDLRPHIQSLKCLCNPQDTGEGVIVHNSFDGREFDEEFNEKVN